MLRMILGIRYVALVFLFSISTLEAATTKGSWLLTSLQSQSKSLNKPLEIQALEWITRLEEARDKADNGGELLLFQSISEEISETIGGKYGTVSIDPINGRIVASILRTRDRFSGMPDIVDQMYFKHDPTGCWERVRRDKTYSQHIGEILAVDAILFSIHNNEEFEEIFYKSIENKSIPQDLITSITNTVLDIHGDTIESFLKDVMSQIRPKDWEKIIDAVGVQLGTLAPRFTLEQVFTELCVSGEGYKGWTPCKVDQLVSWLSGVDQVKRRVKQYLLDVFREDKSKTMTHTLSLLMSKAILVNDEMGRRVTGSDYHPDKKSALLVIPYVCFLPLMNKTLLEKEPIIFYVTKKIPYENLASLFLVNKPFSLECISPIDMRLIMRRPQGYFEYTPSVFFLSRHDGVCRCYICAEPF